MDKSMLTFQSVPPNLFADFQKQNTIKRLLDQVGCASARQAWG
jgi:hypothetical protein